ncbi:elastin-like isoform X2 [Paramacrobiotus metropolitanus]|uniref:elastin-like isoform X2 n=1 Tax=Paramacrobiotus metropolitanus TaxID=2943436 RepID=UPI002445FC5C|nr:elastin-like isoform X2 [Paramacrobiotus metropolitanus]
MSFTYVFLSALLIGSCIAHKDKKKVDPKIKPTDTQPTLVVDASNPDQRLLFPFGLGFGGLGLGGLGFGGLGLGGLGLGGLGFGLGGFGLGGFGLGFPGLFWDESQDGQSAMSEDESAADESQQTDATSIGSDPSKVIRIPGEAIQSVFVKLRPGYSRVSRVPTPAATSNIDTTGMSTASAIPMQPQTQRVFAAPGSFPGRLPGSGIIPGSYITVIPSNLNALSKY